MSGNGTTIKHLNYEAKHITLPSVPRYNPHPAVGPSSPQNQSKKGPTTRFFGISMSASHTSEAQLDGWKHTQDRYYDTYNNSPFGSIAPANRDAFAAYILGLGTDHAKDQKKLARLIEQWKTASDRTVRGEKYMKGADLVELLPIIAEENEQKILEAGGVDAWEALPDTEKDSRDRVIYGRLCTRFGKTAWAALSAEERNNAQLFVWAGCCMHKEMNLVKGGARAVAEFWDEAGLIGPVKLMNKDNTAAAGAGPSTVCERAIAVSMGGAVKLTLLAGIIFNHKDDKKGQQDSYWIFFEWRLGYAVRFPDTSNTRFQSHCDTAAELIVHLPFYLEFLNVVRDKKDSHSFNHMEGNVYKALIDEPTLTELCVFALYAQAISHPYMHIVRGAGDQRINAVDLGPLHQNV